MDWSKLITQAEQVVGVVEEVAKAVGPVVPEVGAAATVINLVNAGLQFTQAILTDAGAAGQVLSATDTASVEAIIARYDALNEALGAQIATGD